MKVDASQRPVREPSEYEFADARPAGILGVPWRRSIPPVIGVLWAAVLLQLGFPAVALLGFVAGVVVAFVRYKGAPLQESAPPALARLVGRPETRPWTRESLLAAGPGFERHRPSEMKGLELLEQPVVWAGEPAMMGVIQDRQAHTISAVLQLEGEGFPVSSPVEQDDILAHWADALGPLARQDCSVSRVTWQVWSYPAGLDAHRSFLEGRGGVADSEAGRDYETLIASQEPYARGQEVTLTVTVDLRRIRRRRQTSTLDTGLEKLAGEVSALAARLDTAGIRTQAPWSAREVAFGVRIRSDPHRGRGRHHSTMRRSLAAAAGVGQIEWGPMETDMAPDQSNPKNWDWFNVDGSWHRTWRISRWPMLRVRSDWMRNLLTGGDQASGARTVTVVMEPEPLEKSASKVNHELTSLESDEEQKKERGFRITKRERKRQRQAEAREDELSDGHAEFRFAGFVSVCVKDVETEGDEAAAQLEEAAGASLLNVVPLGGRQNLGWLASLPLARSVRRGLLS